MLTQISSSLPWEARDDVVKDVILVVDDEPILRQMAARLLGRHGMRVLEAGEGVSALMLLEQHPEVRLVLLDWQMPGLAGVALLELLRERWPSLPVVVVSGHSPPIELDALTGTLAKPYTFNRLHETVKSALRGEPLTERANPFS